MNAKQTCYVPQVSVTCADVDRPRWPRAAAHAARGHDLSLPGHSEWMGARDGTDPVISGPPESGYQCSYMPAYTPHRLHLRYRGFPTCLLLIADLPLAPRTCACTCARHAGSRARNRTCGVIRQAFCRHVEASPSRIASPPAPPYTVRILSNGPRSSS